MENTCKYSDNWQPYINDYDKFEYDIKLKNGVIIENCYPNAGKFNSISDEHNGQKFNSDLVSEIRFSQRPRLMLNSKVSTAEMTEEYKERIKKYEEKYGLEIIEQGNKIYEIKNNDFNNYNNYNLTKKQRQQEIIPIRNSNKNPKIQNNELCPCNSGKKYKKCCKV
jgi:hypothetical protein